MYMYRALWDRRHSGATRIRQCTRRYNARYIMLKSLTIVGKMFMTICHDIKKLSVLQDFARGIHHLPVDSSYRACNVELWCFLYCQSHQAVEHTVDPGIGSILRCCLTNIGIFMLKIRRSRDRLIFNMGIPYPRKTVFILRRSPIRDFKCFKVRDLTLIYLVIVRPTR